MKTNLPPAKQFTAVTPTVCRAKSLAQTWAVLRPNFPQCSVARFPYNQLETIINELDWLGARNFLHRRLACHQTLLTRTGLDSSLSSKDTIILNAEKRRSPPAKKSTPRSTSLGVVSVSVRFLDDHLRQKLHYHPNYLSCPPAVVGQSWSQ